MAKAGNLACSCCGLLVGVLLLALVGGRPVHAVDTLGDVYTLCNVQKYEAGSAFDDDLGATLAALQAKAAVSSYSLDKGEGSQTLMAAYQCRGDLPLHLCSQCVAHAVSTVRSGCPHAVGSRVQLDGCFLRYENYSFTLPAYGIVLGLCNVNKDNSSSFRDDVASLLHSVTTAAPQDDRLFAASSSLLSTNASASLYALAQCHGYLSSEQCSACLAAHRSSWQSCDHAVGSQIHAVSCYYRFETYPFYFH